MKNILLENNIYLHRIKYNDNIHEKLNDILIYTKDK